MNFDEIADSEKIVTEKALTINKISKMVIMILIVINMEHNILQNNIINDIKAGNIKNMSYNIINNDN